MLNLIIIIVILLVLLSFFNSLYRRYRRYNIYKKAVERSHVTNKKLLVIGDPDNGFMNKYFGQDYGCGDICLDLTGCPNYKNGIKGDIYEVLKDMETNSYVIFISCVLEYVESDKLDNIYKHLLRVSGNDLCIVSVGSYSFESYFYIGRYFTNESDAKNIIHTEYPNIILDYDKL